MSCIEIFGIPKQTCREMYIYKIIQRVAQVKKVYLNKEQGHAEVYLHDKCSVNTVLQMQWSINGSKLILSQKKLGGNLHPSNPVRKFKRFCIKHEHDEKESKYNEYVHGKSTFWTDILHERCQPLHKKVKMKRRKWEEFTLKKENCKKIKDKQAKTKNGKSKEKRIEKKEFLHLPKSDTKSDQELQRPDNNSTLDTDSENSIFIPVYLMQGRKATFLKLTSTEIIDIKRQIHKSLRIPIRLQLIFHNGKLLTGKSKAKIEPFDNIHISIRGRGGMKREDSPAPGNVTEK
ncbi:uncharacterized protein LOC125676565 isoform X2 [Ostrea edulis]|uniref:uncharacterized protein LOC125676565 isoform X2 n=1 Tax=Ostrea edulis TaxID=37623 RepID=UPI0024AFF6BD|nr:uncharacterized protein LOC125676565 isoform X2 [Ostrea edulis]